MNNVALKNPGMSVSSNLDSEQENESEYSCLSKSEKPKEIENNEETVQDMQYEVKTGSCGHSIFPTSSTPEVSENSTLEGAVAVSPSKSKTQINYSGEVTAHVTSDNQHLNLQIRNVPSSDSRTKVVITNKKSLKKSRSYHDSQHQQSQHNVHNKDTFVDDVNGKRKETPNKQTCKMPLIKVEITGEGIEVKYKTIDRRLTVHIERDNEREEREVCYSHSNNLLRGGSRSSYSSDYNHYQREDIVVPDCCIDIPPPEEFADGRSASSNTNVGNEALIQDDLVRESSSIPSIFSSNSESETEKRPKKEECSITEHMPLLNSRLCLSCLNNCTHCSPLTTCFLQKYRPAFGFQHSTPRTVFYL
ncbi:uncharacterized protein LOC121399121 [Xenopus laevis]|uniref:Uncharacterized protein LOC121399121 n=1 Tax=Xenopus laevis TaxID=8355 RepID=A0A8J1LZS0_XENLA|nr:uncharacterized protein LOC121399121 [Xenopus laevis]